MMTSHLRYGLNWVKECWLARPKKVYKSKLKFQQLVPYQKELYKHLKKSPIDREIIWDSVDFVNYKISLPKYIDSDDD